MEYPISRVYQCNDKLDDTYCDSYALVFWHNPVPTPYSCIDIDNIPHPNMLTNPELYDFIPVFVYELKGYSDTEVVRTFYGRVLQIGSMYV